MHEHIFIYSWIATSVIAFVMQAITEFTRKNKMPITFGDIFFWALSCSFPYVCFLLFTIGLIAIIFSKLKPKKEVQVKQPTTGPVVKKRA